MKTKPDSFAKFWRRFFRRPAPVHDRLLFLNMTLFNYTDGWNRTFAKAEYGRSWA